MRKNWDLTEEAFDKFLSWLDPDREEAGRKYEAIRRRLIIIFICKGSPEAEDLADETINRVIRRAQEMAETYRGDPVPYFVTVANNLFLERVAGYQIRVDLPPELPQPGPEPDDTREYECLDQCMEGLPLASRELVLEYYRENKQAKIDHRKKMARDMGIERNALRIRAHRLRAELEECITRCLNSEPADEMDRGKTPY